MPCVNVPFSVAEVELFWVGGPAVSVRLTGVVRVVLRSEAAMALNSVPVGSLPLRCLKASNWSFASFQK